MITLLWDASALVKRFAVEVGSEVVNSLFKAVPSTQMVVTIMGCAEAHAILVRKHNDGRIRSLTFKAAVSLLQRDVIYDPDFGILPLAFESILAGIDLIDKHNINSVDAAILATYLEYSANASGDSVDCVLVASDSRLLRAAGAEALRVFNPEVDSESEFLRLIGS